MKKLLAIAVLAVGVSTSAFTAFDVPPSGAGSYLAQPNLATAPSLYNQTDMTTIKTGAELPAVGSEPGECQNNTSNICAAKFDAAGALISARQGTFVQP